MTVLTKPSMMLSKAVYVKPPSPLLGYESNEKQPCVEEKIEIHPNWPKRPNNHSVYCGMLTTVVMLLMCFGAALMLYQRIMNPNVRHFQDGHCTVSVPIIHDYVDNLRVIPSHWTSEVYVPQMNKEAAQELMNALQEELDLRATMEKITVSNNGHSFNIIHDFNENSSGIIDKERCFILELNPEVVIPPETFIMGLQQGGQFDVSPMRSDMTAMLLVEELTRFTKNMLTKCNPKPVYRLQHKFGSVIRKREVGEPAHDYMHFSGKHVLEIKIENLPEIVAHENTLGQL